MADQPAIRIEVMPDFSGWFVTEDGWAVRWCFTRWGAKRVARRYRRRLERWGRI